MSLPEANAGGAKQPRKRLRIAIATWFYENQPGYLDFAYRINALARRHEVEVLARSPLHAPEVEIPHSCVRVLAARNAGWTHLSVYWARLACYFARSRPDRVLLLGSQLAATALLFRGAPRMVYWNEHPSHFSGADEGRVVTRPLKRLIRRASYAGARSADCVLPIGAAHAEDLARHHVDPMRVQQMDMGVDARFAEAANVARAFEVPGAPLSLVYAGSVTVERGRDIMLGAVAELKALGLPVRLTLAGATADQLEHCAQKVAALGISPEVEVMPRIPGALIPALLAKADAGICLWEDREYWRFNPPTKLFEYLAAGLPVLASRIRTHSDYLTEGETGFLFDYSVEGLVEAVRRMVFASDRYSGMRVKAAAAGRRYLWRTIEPKFLCLVEGGGLNPCNCVAMTPKRSHTESAAR